MFKLFSIRYSSDKANKLIGTDATSAHVNQNDGSPNETSSSGDVESNSPEQHLQSFLDSVGGYYGPELVSSFRQFMERQTDHLNN